MCWAAVDLWQSCSAVWTASRTHRWVNTHLHPVFPLVMLHSEQHVRFVNDQWAAQSCLVR